MVERPGLTARHIRRLQGSDDVSLVEFLLDWNRQFVGIGLQCNSEVVIHVDELGRS